MSPHTAAEPPTCVVSLGNTCDLSCGSSPLLSYLFFENFPGSEALFPGSLRSGETRSSAMTSKDDSKCPAGLEERRRSPLDQLPPPANSNKPLTPFSIEDILSKPSVRRSYCHSSPRDKLPSAGHSLTGRALLSQTSPLCALEELASKTFKGLEVSVLQAAEGKNTASLLTALV